jgi:DNA-binding LacI/PurR family transcriptional regulator
VTAIRQPVDALGARAVALLAEGGAMAPGETLLPVSLVERRSVAAPARSLPATAHTE